MPIQGMENELLILLTSAPDNEAIAAALFLRHCDPNKE